MHQIGNYIDPQDHVPNGWIGQNFFKGKTLAQHILTIGLYGRTVIVSSPSNC